MGKKTLVIISASILLFTSCAGIPFLSSAHQAFENGLSLFNQGKYVEAIPYFQKATELDPDYSEAYFYLGRSFLSLGRYIEAIQPLRTAFRLSPDSFKKEITNVLLDALIGAALSEFKKSNFQNSIDYLRQALTLDPRSNRAQDELVTALIAFGSQLLIEGKTSEAVSAFSEAIEISPRNAEAYVGLARAFFKDGDYFKALGAVKDAVRLDPRSSDAQRLLKELIRP
jgi:tetratricopeptide (TPR) repeat protein